MKKPYKAMKTPICKCGHAPTIRRRRQFDRIILQWLFGMVCGFGHLGYEWNVYCRHCSSLTIYHARTKRAAIAAFERKQGI